MTYEESYRKCKTLDELRKEVAEKVANEKFKENYFGEGINGIRRSY